jgi:TRAP-type C4-dicarboxylate transport system permease small subunit
LDQGPADAGVDGSLLARCARLLAIAGGLLMTAVAVLVTVSVLLRWITDNGISGDFELVQITLAVSIFAFLPICALRRGNVMVDTFTGRLPPAVQRAIDAIWSLLYGGIAALIAWRLAAGARDTIASNTGSMVLGLPYGWAIAACSVLAAFLALVAASVALRLLRARR